MESRSDNDAQIVRYTRLLEAKHKSSHLVAFFFFEIFFIKAGVEQYSSGRVTVWRNREHVVLDFIF